MKKHLLITTLFVLILSACAPASPTTESPSPTPIQPLPTIEPTEEPFPTSPERDLPAVSAAIEMLSGQLGVPDDRIILVDVQPAEWPDSCLGLAGPGEMCADVITPGYRVHLRVGVTEFEFHTNADGASIRQAERIVPGLPGGEARPLLAWEGPDCEQFSVTMQSALFGHCGTLTAASGVTPSAVEKVTQWLNTYAAFEAETPVGKVTFTGLGPLVAAPSEQRMMAAWAKLNFDVAQSGQTGAARGLAFAYHREGGIAGFCDDVAVYLAGHAILSDCKGLNITLQLTASQLQQIYEWYDGYAQIDYSRTDPAVADAMTITLSMPGAGDLPADEETIQAITEFCAGLIAQASFNEQVDGSVLEAAEKSLREFFSALYGGDYILGSKLYGGDTQILQDWNPDIQNDLPAWLERGCNQNGLMCLLPRSLTYIGSDAEGALQFVVEFNNPDGTLFQRGPCCGDETGLIDSAFLIRVKQQADLWLVLDLPPYVP